MLAITDEQDLMSMQAALERALRTSHAAFPFRLHHQVHQCRALLAKGACHLRDGCEGSAVVTRLVSIGHTGAVGTLIGNVGRFA